jgi:gluconate 2-dehydrogenase gamma chain
MTEVERPPDDGAQTEGTGFLTGRFSRGRLLKVGVASAATAATGSLLTGNAAAETKSAAAAPALRFLTQWEYDYVTAMAETIWPTDDLGPGAKAAGVADYIDGQLAGSWGQGHRFYLNGPFLQPADTGHGWQIPMTPADVYRAFLPGFDAYVRTTYGNTYPALPAATQTQAMTDLQKGTAAIQVGGVSAFKSSDFFTLFRQNVLEGMLSDPSYGGNKDMVGWKYIGFPGDPMRRGDLYFQYIFTKKTYPYAGKPLPLSPAAAKVGATKGAARTTATGGT